MILDKRQLLNEKLPCHFHNLTVTRESQRMVNQGNFIFRRKSRRLCQPPFCDLQKYDTQQCSNRCPAVNVNLATQICRTKVPIVKTIRFPHLTSLNSLSHDLDVYTIFLVRDPRGVFNSRAKIYLDEKRTKFSTRSRKQLFQDIDLMCVNVNRMLNELKTLGDNKRVLLVRYEDVAMRSLAYAKQILEFVDLKFEKNIKEWVESQLKLDNNGATGNRFSTNKNPTQVALRWREEIEYADLEKVQQLDSCQKMMANLGYVQVQVKTDSNTTVIQDHFWCS